MRMSIRRSRLNGSVQVQGSKNAGQKIIPSLALSDGVTHLRKCSLVGDNRALLQILEALGAKVSIDGNDVRVDTTRLASKAIPRELTAKTTGSFIFAGALLGRFGRAELGAPGGDELGSRPVDFHLAAFEAMGVSVTRNGENYILTLTDPRPADYTFPRKTANGTVNAVLLASTLPGLSIFRNVDWDPDIKDHLDFMTAAGADIRYDESSGSIRVQGAPGALSGCEYRMLADRNDAVTWLCAGLLGGGSVTLTNVPDGVQPAIDLVRKMGAHVDAQGDSLTVSRTSGLKNVSEVVTAAYPGFSTDWGPMLQALMCISDGEATFTECVFAYRFSQIDGFVAMGADIEYIQEPMHEEKYRFPRDQKNPHSVRIAGVPRLHGASVTGKDIRGAAALLIAGLAADGVTTLDGAEQLLRGYEDIVGRIRGLGGDVSDIA